MDIQKLKDRIIARSRQFGPALVVAILAGTGGLYAMQQSSAATFATGSEAETGTVAANAKVVNAVAGVSGNGTVLFGSETTPPTPPVTPPVSGACPAWPALPNEACTGPPSGYALAAVSSLTTTSAGQTIDGKAVSGSVNIMHDNVKITSTTVKGNVFLNGHSGIVLQNVDIGPDSCPSSGNGGTRAISGGDGYSLIRSHVHNNPDDLLSIGGGSPVLIQDSIVNRACVYPGDHLDAIQWYDPGAKGNVVIAHSVIDIRPVNSSDNKGNAAVFIADGAGAGTSITLYNNSFAGGNYSTSFYDAVKNSGWVVDAHDNVYVKGSYAVAPCSFGGSVKSIAFDGTSGVKFANNKLDDGTAVSCN